MDYNDYDEVHNDSYDELLSEREERREELMEEEIKSLFKDKLHFIGIRNFEILEKNDQYAKGRNYKIGSLIYECVAVEEEENEPCLYEFELQ